MKVILLDCETTGIEKVDRLCQICFKVLRDKMSYEGLFKPPLPISVEAMSITHITNEMVEKEQPFIGSSACIALEDYIDDGAVIVAHNAQFDVSFLNKEGLYPKKVICTMKLAHVYDSMGKLSKHNLQYLRYFYHLKVEGKAHDASGDVAVLEQLFLFYLDHFTIDEMIEISSKPILLKVFPFGKYKKEKFEDVIKKDRNYFQWMLVNVEMEENLKYTITHYLTKSR